jgi:hypothetical protein
VLWGTEHLTDMKSRQECIYIYFYITCSVLWFNSGNSIQMKDNVVRANSETYHPVMPGGYLSWTTAFLPVSLDSFSEGSTATCVLQQVLSPTRPAKIRCLSGDARFLNSYSDGLRAGWQGFYSRRCKFFLYSTKTRLVLGPPVLLSVEYRGLFPRG